MNNSLSALNWIVSLLNKNKIKYRFTGGFAANIYGSRRPLADLDIEIQDENVFDLVKDVSEFIVYGPSRYVDEEFNLLLMTLNYHDQEIDICGVDSLKIFDKNKNEWINSGFCLDNFVEHKFNDILIPVIPLNELIDYKSKLKRKVDIEDIYNLKKYL